MGEAAAKSVRRVGIRELKTQLSRWVQEVKQSSTVVVTEHGRPVARHAGAAPLAPSAKSARKAAKFTQWRPAPGKRRGADPTGLGHKGSPARSSVKRVEWRSHSGSRAIQLVPEPASFDDRVHALRASGLVQWSGRRLGKPAPRVPLRWRQGPSCPGNLGQDRRARRAKFGTARPCRVATLGKGREASGARPQPETARERTQTYVTEPDTARTKRHAAHRPAPLRGRAGVTELLIGDRG